MLYREQTAVYCEEHLKALDGNNPLEKKLNLNFILKIWIVTLSKIILSSLPVPINSNSTG
jgi:hypothetical protein